MVLGELLTDELEELRPTDAIDPLTHAFVFAGVGSVGLDDVLDRRDRLWPTRRIVGQIGKNDIWTI